MPEFHSEPSQVLSKWRSFQNELSRSLLRFFTPRACPELVKEYYSVSPKKVVW